MIGLNSLSSCTLLLCTALFTIYYSLSESLRIPGNGREKNLESFCCFFLFSRNLKRYDHQSVKPTKRKKKSKSLPTIVGFQENFDF